MRVIVGISGASGAVYGVKLLQFLGNLKNVETHLILTKTAEKIIRNELNLERESIEREADFSYREDELDAPLSSGSFKTDGMIVAPCSMKTLACIAHGISTNLLLRAADVTLKEKRRLILVLRETPISYPHVKAMEAALQAGATLMPAMPAFYHKPKSIDDLVNFVVGRILDSIGIEHDLYQRWEDVA